MNQKLANLAFNLLVEHCGALEVQRKDFVTTIVGGAAEYRFAGRLGLNGLFKHTPLKWRVECPIVEMTRTRERFVRRTNFALSKARWAHAPLALQAAA